MQLREVLRDEEPDFPIGAHGLDREVHRVRVPGRREAAERPESPRELASGYAMFLWWGPDLIQIYNDAYRPSFGSGDRYLRAVGAKGAEFWPEIWAIISPEIADIMGGGRATWHEDQLMRIERNGQIQD